MMDTKTLPLTKDVHWIGVLDPDLVTFDVVMETRFGTTYNSYFIDAEKKAIVETCKEKFWPEYEMKIRSLCDPSEIRYIILDHTEPDHSGAIDSLLKIAPNATVVASGNAIRYLRDLLGYEIPHLIVRDGDRLSLGNKTLHFIGAPNLHWPDTMYTWLPEDKVLFTCDSFGCHYCHSGVFDDSVGNFEEAFRYYFDVIIKPYSKFMLKAIEKISGLDIAMIATGHGPVLRSRWKHFVSLTTGYARAAMENPKKNKVLIAYVSAYHNTAKLAEMIAEGLVSADASLEPDVCDIEHLPLSELENKIIESNALIIGSPTINQNMLLHIYQFFALINPIRDKGKLTGSFGSYGWSGEAEKIIESNISGLRLRYFGEGVFIKFAPHQDTRRKCLEYGRSFAEKMTETTE